MTSAMLFLLLALVAGVTMATEIEENITDIASVDDICNNDDDAADVCLACSSLAFQVDITVEICCQSKEAFIFCDACMNDQDSCKVVIAETEALKTMYDEYSDDVDNDVMGESDDADYNMKEVNGIFPDESSAVGVQKRFGKLFVGGPKRYRSSRYSIGKRSDDGIDLDKRFGRLFTGFGSLYRKGSGKRFGKLFTGSRSLFGKRSDEGEGQVDKRYGQVYMGGLFNGRGRNRLFGKRTFDADELDSGADKRFGKLFTFGKRGLDYSDEDDSVEGDLTPLEKRYGSLFVNSRFGKRDGGVDDADNDTYNMDKRFGRLHLNRMKSWGNRFLLGKRYGRLFAGRRKYYFG